MPVLFLLNTLSVLAYLAFLILATLTLIKCFQAIWYDAMARYGLLTFLAALLVLLLWLLQSSHI